MSEVRGELKVCYTAHCPCGESAYAGYNSQPRTRQEAGPQARCSSSRLDRAKTCHLTIIARYV